MNKEMVVLFDIADQAFKHYTREEFDVVVQGWKYILHGDHGMDVENMDIYEVVEAYYGDEMFVYEFEV